ncbi:MAG: trypsin-like peptidase domain-containing protein [Myxococcota bacterium]
MAAATPASAQSLEALASTAKVSVVHLAIHGPSGKEIGSGSGFLVSRDGLVVTNYHVIKKASAVTATFFDGKKVPALGVLGTNAARDIAVIQLEGDDFPALTLGDSTALQQGTSVVVLGSPRGFAGSLSQGIVSAVREVGLPNRKYEYIGRLIQITAPISHGSSGSPVLTSDGEVIGVATLVWGKAQNLNFAVPIEVAKGILSTIHVGAVPQPFSRFPFENLFISLIFFTLLGAALVIGRRLKKRRHGPKHPP